MRRATAISYVSDAPASYYRALRLPETVDYAQAESTFKNGVLTIKLPKLVSKKVRKLEISAV
jgi:HSP20 family molecular chaperone IbpA